MRTHFRGVKERSTLSIKKNPVGRQQRGEETTNSKHAVLANNQINSPQFQLHNTRTMFMHVITHRDFTSYSFSQRIP